MLTRLITGVLGIPVAVLILLWGSPVIDIAGIIIALIGISEFYRVVSKKYKPLKSIGCIAGVLYLVFLEWNYNHFIWYSVIFLMILLIIMVFTYPKYNIMDLGVTFIGTIYVAVLIGFILLMRRMVFGEFFIWFVFISSWGSDTFAYFSGRFFGKHKLAPILSPKKTIEGSVGGLIGAVLLSGAFTLIYAHFDSDIQTLNIGVLLIIVAGASIMSMIGDLTASAIKRFFDEKDYGELFPGHGGVLDRFDSVLFVAPFLYGLLNIL